MDWVVSNRPINIAAESEVEVREFMRILKPGGRISGPVTLANTDFGSLWSPRLEAIKVYHPSMAEDVSIETATDEDVPHIQELLMRENLPTDVEPHLGYYVVARHLGRVIGCSGMEVYGSYAVLRSLTVDPAYRRSYLSQRLLAARNQLALQQGVTRGYMLTTTIAPIVEAWGYRRIDRSQVPQAILETSEFQNDRCASATVLYWDFADCLSEAE
jgi:N-acetylglutamate synthase-like GNAT family acetyltransferase